MIYKKNKKLLILFFLLSPLLLRSNSLFQLISNWTFPDNPLFISMYIWLLMVIVIYYFDLNEKLILLGTLFLIIIFSLDSLQFQSLLQDYYDTDNYDYQEPVWIDLINNKSNLIWNERIGSGHRLVGQIPREYIVFKIVASELFSVFNSYNFYVIFHYLSSALILLQFQRN